MTALMRAAWKPVGAFAAATLVCVPYSARAADPTAAPPSAPASTVAPAVVQPADDNPPFQIDPISDAALIVAGAGYGGILELILSTGEIRPQRPVDPNALLGIDSVAVTQTFDPSAAQRSNFGLYTALAFAVLDPILSGFRDGRSAALVDATLYAESLSVTFARPHTMAAAMSRWPPDPYASFWRWVCTQPAECPEGRALVDRSWMPRIGRVDRRRRNSLSRSALLLSAKRAGDPGRARRAWHPSSRGPRTPEPRRCSGSRSPVARDAPSSGECDDGVGGRC